MIAKPVPSSLCFHPRKQMSLPVTDYSETDVTPGSLTYCLSLLEFLTEMNTSAGILTSPHKVTWSLLDKREPNSFLFFLFLHSNSHLTTQESRQCPDASDTPHSSFSASCLCQHSSPSPPKWSGPFFHIPMTTTSPLSPQCLLQAQLLICVDGKPQQSRCQILPEAMISPNTPGAPVFRSLSKAYSLTTRHFFSSFFFLPTLTNS